VQAFLTNPNGENASFAATKQIQFLLLQNFPPCSLGDTKEHCILRLRVTHSINRRMHAYGQQRCTNALKCSRRGSDGQPMPNKSVARQPSRWREKFGNATRENSMALRKCPPTGKTPPPDCLAQPTPLDRACRKTKVQIFDFKIQNLKNGFVPSVSKFRP
jgi:hypothetical protein